MDKGLIYTLEDEKIIEYMALSVEDKLTWLEEMNQFNRLFLTPKDKEVMEGLREGRI
jgi:hypothetical protein